MEYPAILKWAAGSNKLLPYDLVYNEAMLLDLVNSHSLAGRFLKRLDNYPQHQFTLAFKSALQQLHLKTKNHVKLNLAAFREIKRQLPPYVQMIAIKGFTTYVLVGKTEIKRAGDIDILCNNSKVLIKMLKKMGYKRTRAPFLHELGEYTKGSIEIDLHDYFPVFSYTKPLLTNNLLPSCNLAIWQQNFKMTQNNIHYETLSNFSYIGHTFDVRVHGFFR